jgi:hypothetical protein
MARGIVYAQNAGFHTNPQSRLFVDQWIEIDWKHKVFIDRWTGDVEGLGPSHEVGFTDPYSSKIIQHGVIRDADDIAWLRSAVDHRGPQAGPMQIVSRIHQLGVLRDGKTGFEIEVLTGDDAATMLKKAKQTSAIATLKEVSQPLP